MATRTSRIKTRTPALIPAIFTTRSVCLAGSGMTSGSSVAPGQIKILTTVTEINKYMKTFETHSLLWKDTEIYDIKIKLKSLKVCRIELI